MVRKHDIREDSRSAFLKQLGPLPSGIHAAAGVEPIPTSADMSRILSYSISQKKKISQFSNKIQVRDEKVQIRLLNSSEFRNYMINMSSILMTLNGMELESFIATCQTYAKMQGVRDSVIWKDYEGLMLQWSKFAASLRTVGLEYREFLTMRTI
jgi:hypothetical protein